MPQALVSRLKPNEHDTSHTLRVSVGKRWKLSEIWRHGEGLKRQNGQPNWRDHDTCLCDTRKQVIMPKQAEVKVGSRNREATSHKVEFLFDLEELFDSEGEWYPLLIQKGLTLEEGEDYQVLDSDGEVSTLKSAPEKVANTLRIMTAETLNCPASVKVPETGAHIAASSRNWVSFRPRIDTKFEDDAARAEYIAKYQ